MGMIDTLLSKVDLKYEDLTVAEKDTLNMWLQALDSNQVSTDSIEQFVQKMRESIEQELLTFKESPQSWVGVLSLFIPFYGLIRKWYADQKKLYCEARLRNLVILQSFLTSPKKARQAIELAISNITKNRGV